MVIYIGLILKVLKVAAPILLSSAVTSKGKDLMKAAVGFLLNEPLAKGLKTKGV